MHNSARRPTKSRQGCDPCVFVAVMFVIVIVYANILIWTVRNDNVKGKHGGNGNEGIESNENEDEDDEIAKRDAYVPEVAPKEVVAKGLNQPPPTQNPAGEHHGEVHGDSSHSDGSALNLDVKPQRQRYLQDKEAWPFPDMDGIVSERISHKHWAPSLDEVKGTDMEPIYTLHEALKAATGCDLLSVPFNTSLDKKCVDYLTNISNWKAFLPIAQGFDQRTIKFEVDFPSYQDEVHDIQLKLKSILKVPQKLFPNEAFSEVGLYHADRVMQLNRIPPTGWVCIPTKLIRASVKKYGPGIETVDEFLEESGVKTFEQWIEKDLFSYAKRARLIENRGQENECIGASIQVFMADVGHLLDSALKIPYIPHNASWHRFYDLNNTRDAVTGAPIFLEESYAGSLIHISEITTFDFVMGNGDRSPNKNNFVVGGCTRKGRCGPPSSGTKRIRYLRHPGAPTYIHLDQGMGLYDTFRNNPLSNSISKHKHDGVTDSFCIFRVGIINTIADLLQLSSEVDHDGRKLTLFEAQMEAALPNGVKTFVTASTLRKCKRRMEKIVAQVERCLQHKEYSRYVLAP